MPLVRPLRGMFPLVFAATFNSANSFQGVSQFSQGIPDIILPDISSGRAALPLKPPGMLDASPVIA